MSSASLTPPPTIATISKNGLVFSIKGGSPLPPPTNQQQENGSDNNNNTTLRLVTLNMASGNAGPQWQFSKGSGKNQHEIRRQLIETMFLESKADILCVQESVIKSTVWSYRNENSSSKSLSSSSSKSPSYSVPSQPRKLGTGLVSSTPSSKATATSTATKKSVGDDEVAENSASQNSSSSTENDSSSPHFVRSKEMALTHCGQTFLYYNEKT